jgi:hypothetical protein
MKTSISFTEDEERYLLAMAQETGRTLPRLIHFVSLYGAVLYRELLDKYGGATQADLIIRVAREGIRARKVHASLYSTDPGVDTQEVMAPPISWPARNLAESTPTLDDHSELIE